MPFTLKDIVAKSVKISTSQFLSQKISTKNTCFTTFLNSRQNSVNAFEIKHFYAQCLFLAVLVEPVLVAPVLIAPVLQLLELLALVLVAPVLPENNTSVASTSAVSTGATITGASSIVAGSTGGTNYSFWFCPLCALPCPL